MDIESNRMEKISASVKLDLCNYFNWNDIDVNYNIIDIDEKKIYALSSDYEWQLIYWHHDMDLSLKNGYLRVFNIGVIIRKHTRKF
nr:Uncharacterised protein [Providencia rettgeri]